MKWIRTLWVPDLPRYLFVGGVTAVIYFSVIFLSVHVFDFDHRWGVTIAYIVAVLFHFLMNRQITFPVKDKLAGSVAPQLLRYASLLIVNYLITIGVVSVFISVLDSAPYATYIAVFISTGITVSIGYVLSKFWIFRH